MTQFDYEVHSKVTEEFSAEEGLYVLLGFDGQVLHQDGMDAFV